MTPDIIEELIDDGKYRLTLHLTWPKLFADHLCWFPIRMRSRMEYRGLTQTSEQVLRAMPRRVIGRS